MILDVDSVIAGYGDTEILHGVSIHVEEREIVTIIGPNGAGKSTLLKAVMGYVVATEGSILLRGEDVTSMRPDEKARRGVGYVPQLQNVFPSLSVQENLEMGGYAVASGQVRKRIREAYAIFPALSERAMQRAGTLSGGQRQMVAIARALMNDPSLLMLDEPSAGLAPLVSEMIFQKIGEIHQLGTAIIIVEQDAYQSLSISHRGYVLSMGQNEFEDQADRILDNQRIREAYLGG